MSILSKILTRLYKKTDHADALSGWVFGSISNFHSKSWREVLRLESLQAQPVPTTLSASSSDPEATGNFSAVALVI